MIPPTGWRACLKGPPNPMDQICHAAGDAGLIGGLIGSVDCHIRVLVHESYNGLVGPGTTFGLVLTSLLTIYIALIGYQLALGHGGLRIFDLPVAALKVGLIMAFVTSWAAYQHVVFDLLFDGPRDIAQALLAPTAPAHGGSDLYKGLEHAYAELSDAASAYGAQATPSANLLQGGPMLGSGLLWISALVMLLATIGVILAAKIVLAFLLAIGPVFIALFLFDATRGFFDGWLKTTIAFALTPLAVNVFGATMLLVLAPFINALKEGVASGAFEMGPIVTIALIIAVFAVVMSIAIRMSAGITSGFSTNQHGQPKRGRDWRGRAPSQEFDAPHSGERLQPGAAGAPARDQDHFANASETRRTSAIADAVKDETLIVERLGQSERRSPTPARRYGEAL